MVVTKGQGVVEGPDGYSRNIQRGNYFFVPAAAKDLQVTGDIEFVCCAGAE